MILSTGVDLVEIDRLRHMISGESQRFLHRVFTGPELLISQDPEFLAGRFAAKEAVSKVLGTGIGEISWQDIEILRGEAGQPVLNLHRSAKNKTEALGYTTWSISISHTNTHAVAVAVALGETPG